MSYRNCYLWLFALCYCWCLKKKLSWKGHMSPNFHVNMIVCPTQFVPTRTQPIDFTRGQLWPWGIVIACVCLSVCVCVRQSSVLRTITCHPLKLQSPKLDQKCKTPWLRSPLFLGFIDLDLQGQIELKSQNLPILGL